MKKTKKIENGLVSTKVSRETLDLIHKLKAHLLLETGHPLTDPQVIEKCVILTLNHVDHLFVREEEKKAEEFVKDLRHVH
ncbi:hypothetical protein HUU53_02705 [Candidatus Micrarchaeota archaeon]|nr:hypothetical protein [Candidatus Micrarchaeota archaeon]